MIDGEDSAHGRWCCFWVDDSGFYKKASWASDVKKVSKQHPSHGFSSTTASRFLPCLNACPHCFDDELLDGTINKINHLHSNLLLGHAISSQHWKPEIRQYHRSPRRQSLINYQYCHHSTAFVKTEDCSYMYLPKIQRWHQYLWCTFYRFRAMFKSAYSSW